MSPNEAIAVPGSFRDPGNRVFRLSERDRQTRILRGIDDAHMTSLSALFDKPFFSEWQASGAVVGTRLLDESDPDARAILSQGWAGVLEHDEISFVSYPYEWSFSMLRAAALHHLKLMETALENGWTIKDSTPYNIQFVNCQPVFIDIPSFEPVVEGEPWFGYRQFCAMFLTPLMLRAHLGIDHLPLLRSYLDGIPPTEAAKFFRGLGRLRSGVMSHILFPDQVERAIIKRERDAVPVVARTGRKHSKAMVLGLVQSMRRLVRKLKHGIRHTDWSQYESTHSYEEPDFTAKKAFVERHGSSRHRHHIWDIGCNTGTFSNLVAPYCDLVVSIDGDHDAIEQYFLRKTSDEQANVLPLVMNLANISPDQGWAGEERDSLDHRVKPDMVLCLALIHHVRMSANIPIDMFMAWLRSLDAEVIIEFVDRHDEMVVKLLTHKKEKYTDYSLATFQKALEGRFDVAERKEVKGDKRILFHLMPADLGS